MSETNDKPSAVTRFLTEGMPAVDRALKAVDRAARRAAKQRADGVVDRALDDLERPRRTER